MARVVNGACPSTVITVSAESLLNLVIAVQERSALNPEMPQLNRGKKVPGVAHSYVDRLLCGGPNRCRRKQLRWKYRWPNFYIAIYAAL
jgi:hypothetical protein